jgi:membrane fusion protein (multidrug efflux system)
VSERGKQKDQRRHNMSLQTHSGHPRRLAPLAGILLLTSILCALPGCSTEPEQAPAPQPMEVTAVTIEAKDTPVTPEFVGKTQSSRRVEIRSRVEGFLDKRLYKEGSLVKEGDVLFQMDRKPFEADLQAAEAELAQQRALLANAQANLKRVKPLVEQNAVAQKELDDAEAMYRTSAAAVEAAKAKVVNAELNLGYTTIKTPVTGLSSFAAQQEGAYIGLGTSSLLTYVAQLDPMWVEFSVSENQILRSREQEREGLLVEPDESSGYEVEVVLADGTIYPHRGRITFADASLSEETGTFLIRAELANPDGELRPGQFVRARIKGAIRPNAVLVPQRAVQQGAKGSFVWVVDQEGKAEFRPITVSLWYEDDWFVDQGLQDGETVVVDGALKLQAGMPVKVVEPEQSDKAGKESTETDAARG